MNILAYYFVASRPWQFWLYFLLIAWAPISMIIFITGPVVSAGLLFLYFFYLLITAWYIHVSHGDLFSPPIVVAMISFIAIGLPTPFFARGEFLAQQFSVEVISGCFLIFLVGYLGFIVGYLNKLLLWLPFNWLTNTKRENRKPSVFIGFVLLIYLVLGTLIRRKFSIGLPGATAEIAYSGILYHFFYTGFMVLAIWYFVSAFYFQSRPLQILAVILLLGFASSQALLGWRGGIVQVITLMAVAFWYCMRIHLSRISLLAIVSGLTIIFMGYFVLKFAQERRVESGTFEEAYEVSKVAQLLNRFQLIGTLSPIVTHFQHVTLTNSFMVFDLWLTGRDAVHYNNKVIHNHPEWAKHSFATSAFGSMYIYAGLLGDFIGLFVLGAFYSAIYFNMFNPRAPDVNLVAIVFHCVMINMLRTFVTEHMEYGDLKSIITICFFVFVLRLISSRIGSISIQDGQLYQESVSYDENLETSDS